jgi:hypothetical protein
MRAIETKQNLFKTHLTSMRKTAKTKVIAELNLTSSPPFRAGIPTVNRLSSNTLRRVRDSTRLPRGFKLGFRRKYPTMGIFTTMSQLISPRSHILSTRFTFGLSDHSPIKERIC